MHAQVIEIDRQVIGSGYTEYDDNSSFTLSATVGEPLTQTRQGTDIIITEGFQQSNYVLSKPFVLELGSSPAACIGATNGTAYITYISDNVTPPYAFQWSNGSADSVLRDLTAGVYSLTLTGSNGNSVTNNVRVSVRDSIDCRPDFYTGITPNGDGFNDTWWVDNAEFFTVKKVSIYNRYGDLVWKSDDYSNTNNPFDGTHRNGSPLPDGTYFFIAEFDDSKYRGWIEINR
ncbi:MAG: hypothetical protein Kow0075_05140 [Salibacteraceae bacterium]